MNRPDKVLKRKYAHPTVELAKMLKYVEQKLGSTDEGALVVGRSGIGKTTMITLLREALQKRYPDCYLIYDVTVRYDEVSKKKFYNRLIEDCGFKPGGKVSKRATGEELQAYFAAKLVKEAGKAEKDIILFVDCAERMTHECYLMLSDTLNEVDNITTGISMKVFLFGTTEIEAVRNKFVALNNELVVRRFMKDPYQMLGIDNEKSLRAFLSQYDKRPVMGETNETFTERYFPEAYEDGHRLADDSKVIYKVLRGHIKSDKQDISMKSVVDMLVGMFRKNGFLAGSPKYWPEESDWKKIVEESSIIENMSVSDDLEKAWKKAQQHDRS